MPDNPSKKPLSMPKSVKMPDSTPTRTSIESKTETEKVDRYEEGTSPLLYCQDVLMEYGQESDIPVGHDYWEIKRRIS